MKEILVPDGMKVNYLDSLFRCVQTLTWIRQEQIEYDNKDIMLTDMSETYVLFPPPEFQYNGGTDDLATMLAGGIMGLISELEHPLGEEGINVHSVIERGKIDPKPYLY